MRNRTKEKRYKKTIDFVQKHISTNSRILDLGTRNKLSFLMENKGYRVANTQGENLDIDYHKYIDYDVDVVTSFEIFEHMLAPFNILKDIKTDKIITSIPLKLWFASAYWNEEDDWDKHYHEFEVKQFQFLLDKAGWEIIDSEKWTSSDWRKFGIRPILRHFIPRYYIAYCERKKP